MRIKRRYLIAAAAGVITFVFLVFAVKNAAVLKNDVLNVTMALPSNSVTAGDTDRLWQTNDELDSPLEMVVWGGTEKAAIRNPDTNSSENVELMVLSGRSDILFPDCDVLTRDNREACLLDPDTAFFLFGTTEVTGQIIEYNGREYQVRDLIDRATSLVVVEAASLSAADTVMMDRVTVRNTNGSAASEIKNKLEQQLTMKGDLVAYETLSDFVQWFLLIVPFLFGIFLYRWIRRNGREAAEISDEKKRKWIRIAWWALGWAFLAFFLYELITHLAISQDMIPTQWSDMDFWGTLIEQKRTAIRTFIHMPKRQPDLWYLSAFMKAVLYNVCAIFLYVVTRSTIRLRS